jgi:hypothetical protein
LISMIEVRPSMSNDGYSSGTIAKAPLPNEG